MRPTKNERQPNWKKLKANWTSTAAAAKTYTRLFSMQLFHSLIKKTEQPITAQYVPEAKYAVNILIFFSLVVIGYKLKQSKFLYIGVCFDTNLNQYLKMALWNHKKDGNLFLIFCGMMRYMRLRPTPQIRLWIKYKHQCICIPRDSNPAAMHGESEQWSYLPKIENPQTRTPSIA